MSFTRVLQSAPISKMSPTGLVIFIYANRSTSGCGMLTSYNKILEIWRPLWRVQPGFYQANLKPEMPRRLMRDIDAVDSIARTLSCVSSFPVFARSVGRASNTR